MVLNLHFSPRHLTDACVALFVLISREETAVSQALQISYRNVDNELILKHVEDQYKLFAELRNHLASPWLFDEHRSMFHIDGQLRSEMLEKYYTFDATIVREFLGKKLGDKMRPGLAELSSKLGISHRSTLRQFDNIRRIYKRATNSSTNAAMNQDGTDEREGTDDDDNQPDGSGGVLRSRDLVVDLMGAFQVSKRLARRYARIVYAAVHSFELNKKRLHHLKYKELDLILSYIIKHWGTLADEEEAATNVADARSETFPMLAPHPKLVSRLNQIKAIFSSHKDEATVLSDELRQKLGDWNEVDRTSRAADPARRAKATALISYKFLKSMVVIGTAIGNTKDYKKILSDIADEIVQPCLDVQADANEINELFRLALVEGSAFLTSALGSSAKSSSKRHIYEAWSAYLTGLRKITVVMYEAAPRK